MAASSLNNPVDSVNKVAERCRSPAARSRSDAGHRLQAVAYTLWFGKGQSIENACLPLGRAVMDNVRGDN